MERAMGIEPTSEAWEALNKTLKAIDLAALSFPSDGPNWKLDRNRKQLQIAAPLLPYLHRRLKANSLCAHYRAPALGAQRSTPTTPSISCSY
jgi:hypothetical protein